MGWNEVEHRFCVGQRRWANLKKKEQRYWKEHPVLPIHLETFLWLGNEIATGEDATHPSEMIDESYCDCHTPDVNAHDHVENLDADDQPSPTEVPSSYTVSSARARGQPRTESTSSEQSEKNKGVAEKLAIPLTNMANALQTMALAATDREFSREVNESVSEMERYVTIEEKTRARMYLLHHKLEANSILSASKEEGYLFILRLFFGWGMSLPLAKMQPTILK